MEIWKSIPQYEDYLASNMGNIKSKERIERGRLKRLRKSKIISQHYSKTGYKQLSLCNKNGEKTLRVHRLVLMAFTDKKFYTNSVNHKNGIKSDNRIENLEWSSPLHNLRHAILMGLYRPRKGKKIIRMHDGKVFKSAREAEKLFGYNHSLIAAVCNGKRKTHLGHVFAYYKGE